MMAGVCNGVERLFGDRESDKAWGCYNSVHRRSITVIRVSDASLSESPCEPWTWSGGSTSSAWGPDSPGVREG